MAIFVRNDGNARIFFALSYHFPNCPDGDNWAKKGWWQIPPGGTATVRGGASNGARYFWYAETDTGLQWAGESWPDCPPPRSTGAGRHRVRTRRLRGMRRLDVPWSSVNHTLVLR